MPVAKVFKWCADAAGKRILDVNLPTMQHLAGGVRGTVREGLPTRAGLIRTPVGFCTLSVEQALSVVNLNSI